MPYPSPPPPHGLSQIHMTRWGSLGRWVALDLSGAQANVQRNDRRINPAPCLDGPACSGELIPLPFPSSKPVNGGTFVDLDRQRHKYRARSLSRGDGNVHFSMEMGEDKGGTGRIIARRQTHCCQFTFCSDGGQKH